MKIAVLGYGVVGSGVVELIHKSPSSIAKKANMPIEIKYILDIREFKDSPYAELFTKDFNVILNDEEIDVVVEVIGGTKPAYDFVKRSLLAGKSVVTSNKELVATHGDELLSIAKEKNLNFLFEASVGGGIPIIRPLHQCLAANDIQSISGILNGTTNYILTKMIKENLTFETALKNAQELGYAEANPSADVDGIDTCRKISILASLAYGKHVDPNKVYTEGITKLTLEDIDSADKLGYVVKLLGIIKKQDDGNLYIMVAPFLVDKELPISSVDDVYNAVLVEGDAVGLSLFYGRGAGKLPTASAVVADVIDCAKHLNARKYLFWESSDGSFVNDYKTMPCRRFVRMTKGLYNADSVKNSFDIDCIIENDNEISFITEKIDENLFKDKLNKYYDNVISNIRVFDI